MLAHRVEMTITSDKTLTLENLPFHSGEEVEVIVLSRPRRELGQTRYPLRGTPVQYIEPTEPVANEDWDVLE